MGEKSDLRGAADKMQKCAELNAEPGRGQRRDFYGFYKTASAEAEAFEEVL